MRWETQLAEGAFQIYHPGDNKEKKEAAMTERHRRASLELKSSPLCKLDAHESEGGTIFGRLKVWAHIFGICTFWAASHACIVCRYAIYRSSAMLSASSP